MRTGGRAVWMCSLHKALDVSCFDKDSTAPHCLYSRRLWSWRKNIFFFVPGICSPQAEYDYTFLFSLPLCSSPFFLCLSVFIPLHCFMSTPPHPPYFSHSPVYFVFFLPPNQLWPSFKKKCWFSPTGSASCLPLVPLIPSALCATSSLVFQFCPVDTKPILI